MKRRMDLDGSHQIISQCKVCNTLIFTKYICELILKKRTCRECKPFKKSTYLESAVPHVNDSVTKA